MDCLHRRVLREALEARAAWKVPLKANEDFARTNRLRERDVARELLHALDDGRLDVRESA